MHFFFLEITWVTEADGIIKTCRDDPSIPLNSSDGSFRCSLDLNVDLCGKNVCTLEHRKRNMCKETLGGGGGTKESGKIVWRKETLSFGATCWYWAKSCTDFSWATQIIEYNDFRFFGKTATVGTWYLLHQPAGLHSPSSLAGLSLLWHSPAGSGLWAGLYRYVPDQSGTGAASRTGGDTEAGDWEQRIKYITISFWNATSQVTSMVEA